MFVCKCETIFSFPSISNSTLKVTAAWGVGERSVASGECKDGFKK